MIFGPFTLPVRAFLGASAFAGALLLAQPFAWAQADKSAPVPGQDKQYRQKYSQEHVEQRVIHLHDQLQITPAQESAWKEFAQVMRDNAKAMNALIEKWAQGKDKMTALENMRAHAEMGQEHVQGMNKLVSAFEPLYNSMSAGQKKNADKVFAARAAGPGKGKKQ